MYTLNYYLWLTQNIPNDVFYQQIKRGAALKASNARVADVAVAPSINVPEQFDQVLPGDAQIGLMNSVQFVFGRRRIGNIEAVAAMQQIIDASGRRRRHDRFGSATRLRGRA